MRLLFRALVLLAAATACASALAQSGGLRVRVTDGGTGSPVAGATIVLSSATQQVATTTTRTDAAGLAEFPVLRAGGGYLVRVSAPGYATLDLADLRVSPERVQVVPVGLFPEVHESVGVTARPDVVDLDRPESATTFGAEFTESLPLRGRLYQTLLTLAPGVLDADEDGNPNVHGARASDFRTQVGGVANTDPLTGGFMSHVNLESIDAIEVVTAGAGAEFGRAQGGFANVVQKQGSNDFEGVAGILWNTSRLDGNGAADVPVPSYDWVQPFLQVSGPILRDRLWYRLSHERVDKEEPINLPGQILVTSHFQDVSSDQLTWQVSPRNKLSLQLLRDPLRQDGLGVGTRVPLSASRAFERGGKTWSLAWTAPYSASLLVDSLVAWQDHGEDVLPSVAGVPNDWVVTSRYPTLMEAQTTRTDSGHLSGSYPLDSRDARQRLTVHSQATAWLTPGRGPAHRLKVGFSVENERYFRELDRRPELTVVPPRFVFTQFPLADIFADLPVPQHSNARATGQSAGVFVEDQVRLGPNVSVTAGLRLDDERISSRAFRLFDPAAEAAEFLALRAQGISEPVALSMAFTGYEGTEDFLVGLQQVLGTTLSDTPGVSPLLDQSRYWPKQRALQDLRVVNTVVSPRLAVAWDPRGDGKSKLAVTAGRYYDKVFLSVPLLGMEPAVASAHLVAVQVGNTFYTDWFDSNVDPAARVTFVDPNLRTPYQDELTLSYEREIAAETSVKATWIRRRYRDQLQDVDVNHAVADYGRCRRTPQEHTVLVPSEGVGQPLVDEYTGVAYVDTAPGPGDGRLDDCMGAYSTPEGWLGPTIPVPDGLPDLYVLNPIWGQVMVVTNANTANYSGVVLELVRRMHRGWELDASYTWSRALGDAEQFDQLLGDDPGVVNEERGFLSYDQRHVVKVNAAVLTPWSWRLGAAVRWESGLPYSSLSPVVAHFAVSPQYGLSFPQGQLRYQYDGSRNDRRNPSFWNVDLRAAREFALRGTTTLSLTGEVFNALNDDTERILEVQDDEIDLVRRFGRRFQVGVRVGF